MKFELTKKLIGCGDIYELVGKIQFFLKKIFFWGCKAPRGHTSALCFDGEFLATGP